MHKEVRKTGEKEPNDGRGQSSRVYHSEGGCGGGKGGLVCIRSFLGSIQGIQENRSSFGTLSDKTLGKEGKY